MSGVDVPGVLAAGGKVTCGTCGHGVAAHGRDGCMHETARGILGCPCALPNPARPGAAVPVPWCLDCNGAGMVPAGGWEPAEEVTDGYVTCPSCAQDQR